MSSTEIDSLKRRSWIAGIVYSIVVLGIGLWVSLATGEWIALLCASGLVILPVGGVALRARKPPGRAGGPPPEAPPPPRSRPS